MTAADQPTRRRLGEVLVEAGLLTHDQLCAALDRQAEHAVAGQRARLGQVVVELGFVTERGMAESLADLLGLDFVDLGRRDVAPDLVRLLPRAVAERCRVVVLGRTGRRLHVATSDPTNVVALDDVRLYTQTTEVALSVATDSQVGDQLRRAWSLAEDATDVTTLLGEEENRVEAPVEDVGDADAAPVVRLVNVVLADAQRAGASDVHVEPQAGGLRIRYRIDGLLRDVMTVPRSAAASLVSRIKIMSGLDIAERRQPQDGRARLQVEGQPIDARVSTLPSLHGEKVVVRLLPGTSSVAPLTSLGMADRQLDALLGALTAPQGLVLITGPTGSGKTNTLYAAIHQTKTPDRNVVTLEDPVEVEVPGITQVQVHERAGLTFARGLRSILRQDPDIVLVGEVRDTETAELALEASLTGHLVLTTLHTNSAVAALTRLVDMGVEPFLVASSLSLVVAQRLVRRPCGGCAAPYTPSSRTLALLGLTEHDLAEATPRRGRGCSECGGTGYRGRVGVFEVLPVTGPVRQVLLRTPSEGALAAAARALGMTSLRANAVAKARRGETTFEEVLRVTQGEAASGHACTSCHRGLDEDMVVCPWCDVPVDRGHCQECARPLDADWRVCPWCRTAAPCDEVAAPAAGPALPRVLVVDDDASVRGYVEAVLTGVAEVHLAATAGEALELVATLEFDGALVDHHLPDLVGTELVRLLRTEPSTAALPLLVFTGSAAADAEAQATLAGADGLLAKPVEPALLEERVLELVARSRRLAAETRLG